MGIYRTAGWLAGWLTMGRGGGQKKPFKASTGKKSAWGSGCAWFC